MSEYYFPNTGRAIDEAKDYPRGLAYPPDTIGQVLYWAPAKAAGLLGAGVAAAGEIWSDSWNLLTGGNDSRLRHDPIPSGPFGRTRRMVGEALGPVFSAEVFRHPIRTIGGGAIRLVSGVDKVLLDLGELPFGEGRGRVGSIGSETRTQLGSRLPYEQGIKQYESPNYIRDRSLNSRRSTHF